jgi:hypothetical protein
MLYKPNGLFTNVSANIQRADSHGQDDVRQSGIIKRDLPFVIPEMLQELSRLTKQKSFEAPNVTLNWRNASSEAMF